MDYLIIHSRKWHYNRAFKSTLQKLQHVLAEHTRKGFHRLLSIRENNFIADGLVMYTAHIFYNFFIIRGLWRQRGTEDTGAQGRNFNQFFISIFFYFSNQSQKNSIFYNFVINLFFRTEFLLSCIGYSVGKQKIRTVFVSEKIGPENNSQYIICLQDKSFGSLCHSCLLMNEGQTDFLYV